MRARQSAAARSERAFAAALLDAECPVPPSLTAYNSPSPTKRFAIYRNNVAVGLVDALARRFPVVQKIVGEEFFRAMARVYVGAAPPRSPLLMFYGDSFPEFVARFEPAAELPYLADVARLEAARTRAYHAADAVPMELKSLQGLDESSIGELRIAPHPSAEVVRSQHPIVTIWAMNMGDLELGPIEAWQGEDALVVRPDLEVFVRTLPVGGAAFLKALFAGKPLTEAAVAAQAESEDFDLVTNLAGLISSGAMVGITHGERRG